jgi:hypothetical protein
MTVNFADLSADMLVKICDELGGDGHTIWSPEILTRVGVPQEFVESVTQTYKSDGSPKGSIFDDKGNVKASETGVYGLSVYRRIGRDLGLEPTAMSGRGFEARDWDRRIRKHLKV